MQGNILLVANFPSDVGYAWWLMEVLWAEIARHFNAEGRETFLIYPTISRVPTLISQAPITILQHDFADRSREACKHLRHLIRSRHITSMYLTDQPYCDLLYAKLRLWGVRNIVMHDHVPGERPSAPLLRQLFKHIIHSMGVFSCTRYIGVSRFVMERFINHGKIPRERCSYVSNGIVPIQVRTELKAYAYQRFGLPEDATIVITTGRSSLYKGIDFIIRCAEQLVNHRKYSNLYFIHCGDGPDQDVFARMIAERHLGQRFILAGKRSDIPSILQSCHIAMHASHGEAFSLSILEYMSAGLAVLAPKMCGNGEAIEDGVSGVLYEPGDMNHALGLLEKLISDEEFRCSIGEAARQRVVTLFTIEEMKKRFIGLISAHL